MTGFLPLCLAEGNPEDIKHFEDAPLPNDGAVYPMWTQPPSSEGTTTTHHLWSTVRYQDVMRLVPHATIKRCPRCHTFQRGFDLFFRTTRMPVCSPPVPWCSPGTACV